MDELSVKCVLYADDQVILASLTCDLHATVTKMNDSEEKAMKVNVIKTEVMVFEKSENITGCGMNKKNTRITAKEVENHLAKAFDNKGLKRRVGFSKDLITTTLGTCQNIEESTRKTIKDTVSSRRVQSQSKLELIHSDVGGPIEVPSLGGISHQTSAPYTTQQNRLVERMSRTVLERATWIPLNAKLQKIYLAEAVSTAAYITNRCIIRVLAFSTPEEKWNGKKPDITHMKTFGCEAIVHVSKEKDKKWESIEMIFIGYSQQIKGYRLLDLKK
ncbi:Retrovirus-related Pol polyprotein from transposon TNT 1-94 [Eumeta japonica]|uniref:Retrovirus-related Pol polyprotein from transposon TNT 1-94 n=1 Tax=Eumeta variegata TaxID=151549 RepID=A0A4C1TUX6_EUMVA|nr:Retrovirus-related Pol polyprotein from transposon TNT 1-94 [Eumeta japonica]